ncbi:MAG: glycosyltransferase [Solirubrobacteraceae bacterium]
MTVLGEGWYAAELGLKLIDDEPLPRWLRRSNPVLRGIALWWRGRQYDIVVLTGTGTLFRIVMLLERIWPRRERYLVLLQFIPVPARRWAALRRDPKPKQWVRLAFQHQIVAPVLRSSLARAHTLSSWEQQRSAATFGVALSRFVFLPWPLSEAYDKCPLYEGRGQRVLASGRTLCDWPTVFAAAEGQGWDLEIVCTKSDLRLINRLNVGTLARIRNDIPLEEHRELLREKAVYLLALHESEASSGQVRLMDAVRGGTPLVASSVRGLSDYIEDGETALLFNPGDALAARAAVNMILADRELSERLSTDAFERARSRTREGYMKAIQDLIQSAAAE